MTERELNLHTLLLSRIKRPSRGSSRNWTQQVDCSAENPTTRPPQAPIGKVNSMKFKCLTKSIQVLATHLYTCRFGPETDADVLARIEKQLKAIEELKMQQELHSKVIT